MGTKDGKDSSLYTRRFRWEAKPRSSVDVYRSPRAPHITITMVYNAVSAKISRGRPGYRLHTVSCPREKPYRHRGGPVVTAIGGSRVPSSSIRLKEVSPRGTPTTLSNLFDNLIGKFIQIFRRRCTFSYRFDDISSLSRVPSYFQFYPTSSILEFFDSNIFQRGGEKGINFSRKFPANISYNCKFTSHRESRGVGAIVF